MELTCFIQDLLKRGKVTVAGQLMQFGEEDKQEAVLELKRFYDEDKLTMPGVAPDFLPEAAIWSAEYVYHAIQLTMLRDVNDEVVVTTLTAFPGPVTPQAVYSVDLMFRYLPDLLGLAKGLAPGDILVENIKKTLQQWPFSSFGTDLEGEVDHTVIVEHTSLAYAYVDRIIEHKDKKRVTSAPVQELVKEALGDYASVLWPDFIRIAPNN